MKDDMNAPRVWPLTRSTSVDPGLLRRTVPAPPENEIPPAAPRATVRAGAAAPSLPVVGPRSAALMEALATFARQDETILISGPSGAGKSRLAELCHAISPRREGPFQLVDLLSIPEEMQMAELFGWRRGAFTGAVRDQDGCVGSSDGGTLFIDEIDKLSLRTQAGLLQFMETRRYRPLGDPGQMRPANVRFIVATNTDLRAQVARGLPRGSLFPHQRAAGPGPLAGRAPRGRRSCPGPSTCSTGGTARWTRAAG